MFKLLLQELLTAYLLSLLLMVLVCCPQYFTFSQIRPLPNTTSSCFLPPPPAAFLVACGFSSFYLLTTHSPQCISSVPSIPTVPPKRDSRLIENTIFQRLTPPSRIPKSAVFTACKEKPVFGLLFGFGGGHTTPFLDRAKFLNAVRRRAFPKVPTYLHSAHM